MGGSISPFFRIDRAVPLLVAVFVASLTPGTAAQSCGGQWLPDDGVTTTGTVYAFAVLPNGNLVVGGQFTTVGGPPATNLALWNGSSWANMGSAPSGAVYALTTLPNGDLIVGGSFTSVGGTSANRVARWNGATWAPLGAGMNNTVYCLTAYPDGAILAGGSFTEAGGKPRFRVAIWNGTEWTPLGTGLDGIAYASLRQSDGEIVVGGSFTVAGGKGARSVARWNGSTWSPFGEGLTGNVYTLNVSPVFGLLAGGSFKGLHEGGWLRGTANWDGFIWRGLVSLDGNAYATTTMPGNRVLLGGGFSTVDDFPAKRIARFADGSGWSAMGGGAPYQLRAIAILPDGEMVVGGLSGTGQSHSLISRWTDTNIPWISMHPQPTVLEETAKLSLSAVPVNGYSGVSYQWRRNGVNIQDGSGGASAGGGIVTGAAGTLPSPTANSAAVLTIDVATSTDAGDYSIVFTNACGSVTSKTASVRCYADYDANTLINGIDFDEFVIDFEAGINAADVNRDGWVNGLDFDTFAEHFEAGC